MRKCYQIVFFGWERAEPEARETGVGAIGKWGRERATKLALRMAVVTESLA